MAGKVGCGLLLAVLFCAAAVSRAPFVVFLLALAMVFTAFLWWDARTLRRQVTAALQLPAKPVRPGVLQVHGHGKCLAGAHRA